MLSVLIDGVKVPSFISRNSGEFQFYPFNMINLCIVKSIDYSYSAAPNKHTQGLNISIRMIFLLTLTAHNMANMKKYIPHMSLQLNFREEVVGLKSPITLKNYDFVKMWNLGQFR